MDPESLNDMELTIKVVEVLNALEQDGVQKEAAILLKYLYAKSQRLEKGIRKIIKELEVLRNEK